ncbi:MAG: response regulator [Treponema sp.]|jgi:putative two-component system response regulator|nr:response regulator [Treponema sp.]
MKTIFIIDDNDTNLSMAETALEDHYHVMTMPSAEKMFKLLEKVTPDLFLLDIEMPDMDGFETLKKLKSSSQWSDIPVMFLTGRDDTSVEAIGLEMGAVDFVTKPFSAPVLLNRIMTHLNIDEIIRQKTLLLRRLQNSIVSVMADMVTSHYKGENGRIELISKYTVILINGMKANGVYAEKMADWDEEKIKLSARMHDLGKIYITDLVKNKPEKLTDEEYELMKTHAIEGERIVDEIISGTGESDFLNNAKLFAGYHHERWDGDGYPYKLKGEGIPLQGRIMAIVDAYDALVSEKPYKKAYTDEEAVKIIMENSGTQYDPKIADVFYKVKDLFKAARKGE